MFISGIADEAGKDLPSQIRAHQELGWKQIELRLVRMGDKDFNICEMPDNLFDQVAGQIEDSGLQVSCFGSKIGDWSRPITTSFLGDANVLRRAIKRMKRLKVPFIRVMSYPNSKDNPLPYNEWRLRSVNRMNGLVKIAQGEGVVLAHENCSGWGGITADNNMFLLEEINDSSFRVLFDTGNPVTYNQRSWDWYRAVKDWIVYIHIKDAIPNKTAPEGFEYTLPGNGQGNVGEILADLLQGPYADQGVISIEPHMKAVIHTGQETSSPDELYNNYIEYGRHLESLVKRIT